MGSDLTVVGATGFVGRLVAEHLATSVSGVTIRLAGRSESKLRQLRDRLGADWAIHVVDITDAEQVGELVADTRVVATTAGPYARYGEPLVAACARTGTHYADLTGEVLFVRRMIERYHAAAQRSGARIVHSCGFDSVPSDVSVALAAQAARADGQGELEWATFLVRAMRGGFSGGTVESMREQLAVMRADAPQRRIVADPFALSPDRLGEADTQPPDFAPPSFDSDVNLWTAPFMMAPYNTRIVRRSNALQDWRYGRDLQYREVVGFRPGLPGAAAALGTSALMAAFGAGMAFAPTRKLLGRVLPEPGAGPGERVRREGYFSIETHARARGGARYVSTFGATGDPGYAATSVMIGQSALALACDGDRLPSRAGVLTPVTGIGDVLAERLREQGFRIEVRRRR